MIAIILLIMCILIYAWIAVNPKLDWNYKTGSRLLWFNNVYGDRVSITLYIDKNKIQD